MASGRVAGKAAIVTGAGLNERGLNIGGATARLLARKGASVLAASRTLADVERLVEMVRAEGGTIEACQYDQGDEASIERLIERCVEQFRSIDILVNNAVPCWRKTPRSVIRTWRFGSGRWT